MRVLGKVPHPKLNITAFTLEKYYYVEIEAGPMKQAYKLHKEGTNGMADIVKWLNEEFLSQVLTTFETMYSAHTTSLKRLNN